MRNSKRLFLLQAVAILIAVFQCCMRAAGQEEGRNSNRILNNPYLTVRYAKNRLESGDVPISTTARILFKLTSVAQSRLYEL